MKNTKEILLKTATKIFAEKGFDSVSTRELAKKSGTNLCSINYYFGSKQKLYDAVVENIAAFILNNFIAPMRQELTSAKENLSPRDEIKFILSHFFTFLCSEKSLEIRLELLLREMFNPSPAYNCLYSAVIEPVHKHLSGLIAADTDKEENDALTILLAHTLLGQVIIFKLHREALLRRLGIKSLNPEFIKEAQILLMQNCDAILDKAKEN